MNSKETEVYQNNRQPLPPAYPGPPQGPPPQYQHDLPMGPSTQYYQPPMHQPVPTSIPASSVTVVSSAGPTVMVSQTMVTDQVTVLPLGHKSSPMTCRSCNVQIFTSTKSILTWKTHLTAALLCIFGCWPCVIVPYCSTTCQNIEHYCPSCSSYLGTYYH